MKMSDYFNFILAWFATLINSKTINFMRIQISSSMKLNTTAVAMR